MRGWSQGRGRAATGTSPHSSSCHEPAGLNPLLPVWPLAPKPHRVSMLCLSISAPHTPHLPHTPPPHPPHTLPSHTHPTPPAHPRPHARRDLTAMALWPLSPTPPPRLTYASTAPLCPSWPPRCRWWLPSWTASPRSSKVGGCGWGWGGGVRVGGCKSPRPARLFGPLVVVPAQSISTCPINLWPAAPSGTSLLLTPSVSFNTGLVWAGGYPSAPRTAELLTCPSAAVIHTRSTCPSTRVPS